MFYHRPHKSLTLPANTTQSIFRKFSILLKENYIPREQVVKETLKLIYEEFEVETHS